MRSAILAFLCVAMHGLFRQTATGFAGSLYEDGSTPCAPWQVHEVSLVR